MQTITALANDVMEGLMRRYQDRVPDVNAIINAMITEGIITQAGEIENDHIAFRTLGVPHLGIRSLERIFLHLGYEKRDYYNFAEKKLDAYWYAPPKPELPRIFISELRVPELSDAARNIISRYTSVIQQDPVDALDLNNAAQVDEFLHSGLWETPAFADYQVLLNESEYAAWVIFNRYYLNHFTISVHNLKEGYDTIPAFNAFLERHGFVLNNSGGKIKTSPDGNLLQSATVARKLLAEFAGGVQQLIPGSYVEFAERKVLEAFRDTDRADITRHHRREGFEAANANRIFESTYRAQTER
ncbi:DUF1338 domain-containing protein [Flavihumibacter petaseus]|nr:DUF1338 domain-containing protein [Flavihumibacter petaseus]